MSRSPAVTAVTLIAGVAVWFGVSLVAGVREAWDHPLYWQAGYPLLAFVSLVAGYLDARVAWRVPLLLAAAQCVAMVLQNAVLSDASFSLLPLGLLVFAILSLPLMVPAYIGAGLARYRERR